MIQAVAGAEDVNYCVACDAGYVQDVGEEYVQDVGVDVDLNGYGVQEEYAVLAGLCLVHARE